LADINLNPGQRLHVYGALFRINRSLTNVAGVLHELEDQHKIFNPARLKELRGMAREFQCEINHYLLGALLPVDDEDWFHFGKARIAREHRLNSERPAFRQGIKRK
jgi:hypothetical protein